MTALRMSQAKGEGANGRSPRNQPDKAGHRNTPRRLRENRRFRIMLSVWYRLTIKPMEPLF